MKKIMIAAFGLFLTLNTYAQDPFSIGLKAGGSLNGFGTTINYPEINNFDENTKPGFLFGVFSRIHIWEVISLQPEVYYSRKTSEATARTLYDDGDNTAWLNLTKNTTLNFIDIPLLVHVKAVNLRNGNLYAIAGPSLSIIASDSYKLGSNFGSIGDNLIREEIENAVKNDFETMNYTIQAGVGYEVNKFNFDLRYEAGLNEMSKGNYNMTSSALMLNIGLKFL
ncbi:PorT family protein [Labilibacter sediminis]|nr:PorT family protein [Labilibacter sediminis]